MTDSEDAELLQVFLEEAREHLDGIEGDLLQLESQQELDPEIVNKIFGGAISSSYLPAIEKGIHATL